MNPTQFRNELQEQYDRMLEEYQGGLSNTSTAKFRAIVALFQSALALEDPSDIYAVGAGTRPGNLEVRLNQGVRTTLHTTLGLGFIKAVATDATRLTESALTTIEGFLRRGKGNYDTILVLVETDGRIAPSGVVSFHGSPIHEKLMSLLDVPQPFPTRWLDRPSRESGSLERASQSAWSRVEEWKIPNTPLSQLGSFPRQRLVEGCAGSGKSYVLETDADKADHVIRTVFHPESGFSDFLGFLTPATAFRFDSHDETSFSHELPGQPLVYYSMSCGPMLEAYVYAALNPSHHVVLIIEELSRAPAAMVFGEVLQLLDRVEREEPGVRLPPIGFSRYQIRPRTEVARYIDDLQAYPDHTGPLCMRFPDNLYIWATMNRADQNARQLDTAFLRRWKREHRSFDAAGAYDSVPAAYAGKKIEWGKLRRLINHALLDNGVREDKLLGPYFAFADALEDPARFADDVLAYLWHDVLRGEAKNVFPSVRTFTELREAWIAGTQSIGLDASE